jgi:hypothetical protein
MKEYKITLLTALMLLSVNLLIAQGNTQLGLDIASAQEKNMSQLKGYSWQRSSKIFVSGEEKTHNLVKVWFNSAGQMESSVLSAQSTVKQKRGVRGKVQQGKGQDMADLLEKSVKKSLSYVNLSKGNWIDMMDRAMVLVDNGEVKIVAKSVLEKDDDAQYLLDFETKLLKLVKFTSVVEGMSFTSSIAFKIMNDGTNHPTVMSIIIPSESLKITAENIDYIKQN